MARPTHLHSTAGGLVATVAVLLAGVGVVSAQAGPSQRRSPAATTTTAAVATTAAPEPTTSTTAAPTTTTTAPPPPPTTAPAPPPAPPTTRPPRRAPAAPVAPATTAPPPAPAARPTDGAAYAMDLVRSTIPGPWLAAVPVSVRVIPGKTSWSNWSGLIEIGDWHLFSSEARARSTLAHEWGHQVAWHYGTDAYNGAPPAGFPYSGPSTEEQWADCVAQALTGTSFPSHGLGSCPSAALGFTQQFLAGGPGPKLR